MPRYRQPTYERLRDAVGAGELMADLEGWPEDRRSCFNVLEAREHLRRMSGGWPQGPHFVFLRALERLGQVTFDRDDDALREELLRYGVGLRDPELRAWLGGITGASKAGRAARALLAET